MASNQTSSASPAGRFPQWQGEYEAALRETDHRMLFKRVEIAEAAILNRRETLKQESDGRMEQQEIERALEKLRVLKEDILNFPL
jgi:hypothetical protein